MIRRAFTLRLKPGAFAEYKRYHDNIWPELVAEIEKSGIATITTFENDPVLFLFSEICDEKAWDKLWHSEIHKKWAEVMMPFLDFRPDGIVDFKELREIFRVQTKAGQQSAKPQARTIKKPAKAVARRRPARSKRR